MEADKQKDEIFVRDCPIRNILSRISDKWSILVIFTLEQTAVMRFGELQRAIPDISQKMLTVTLRTLEQDGIEKSRRDKGGLYRARPVRIRRDPRTVPFPATLLLPKYERGSGLHPPASPVETKSANP